MLRLASLLLLLSSVYGALFNDDTKVKVITSEKDIEAKVTAVITFVVPWCPHSRSLAPEYSKAADHFHPNVPFYAVDCEDRPSRTFCRHLDIPGYPIVKFLPKGDITNAVEYDGNRNAVDIENWVTRSVPEVSANLASLQDVDAWLTELGDQPRALLMSSFNGAPLEWATLADKYQSDVWFAMHLDPTGEDTKLLGFGTGPNVQPTILTFPAHQLTGTLYQGKLDRDSLEHHLGALVYDSNTLRAVGSASPDQQERLILGVA